MLKRSFIGFSKPWLKYGKIIGRPEAPVVVPVPPHISLYIENTGPTASTAPVAVGTAVKTGQRLPSIEGAADYTVSTVTGTVTAVRSFAGDFGRTLTEVRIETAAEDIFDGGFSSAAEEPSVETLKAYMKAFPGRPGLSGLFDEKRPVHTIVILGMDSDLLSTTAHYAVATETQALKKGIQLLKTLTKVENIHLAVPRDVFQGFGHLGASLKSVDNRYPAGLPKNIMREVLGQVVPAGKSCEDLGVTFISAETVAAVGKAFDTGRLPTTKIVTVINKQFERTMTLVRIGTPLKDIFDTLGIDVSDGDRIVLGGPMTGSAVHSLDLAIQADIDAVVVQDKGDIPYYSDYPCINCGQCVRICPTKVPVNMLVRFLEAGQYEEAADQYDLYACIDCGLCSFVCVAKIPIFQYIRLGKHELARAQAAEASDE